MKNRKKYAQNNRIDNNQMITKLTAGVYSFNVFFFDESEDERQRIQLFSMYVCFCASSLRKRTEKGKIKCEKLLRIFAIQFVTKFLFKFGTQAHTLQSSSNSHPVVIYSMLDYIFYPFGRSNFPSL